MEFKYGQTGHDTKGIGSKVKQWERGSSPMFTEMYTMDSGKTTRRMVLEHILMLKRMQDFKVIGKMICSMDQEYRYTVMAIVMKGCSNKAKDVEKALTTMQRERSTREDGITAG